MILRTSLAFLSEEANPLLMPGEVQVTTPLRVFTESFYENERTRETLNVQLGVERKFYSNSLENTVSVETNFAFPLYHDVNAVEWNSLDAKKIVSPMQLPSEMQFGVNFKLFF